MLETEIAPPIEDNPPTATAYTVLGTTVTLAAPPLAPAVLLNTPSSIGLTWNANNNPGDTAYEVRYTNTTDEKPVVIAIPFSSHFTNTSVTLSGLLTGRSYLIQIYIWHHHTVIFCTAESLDTLQLRGSSMEYMLSHRRRTDKTHGFNIGMM